MNFPVTYDALQPYLLAKGKERACYRNPVNTNTVIKLSHCSFARQSLRELTYFEVLKRRKVPATHIPFFVGRVNIPGYVGIEQQLICDFDGSPSKSLFYYLSNKTSSIYFQLPDLLEALYHFLYRYGIALSDLSGNNILIRREKNRNQSSRHDRWIWNHRSHSNLSLFSSFCPNEDSSPLGKIPSKDPSGSPTNNI